MIGKVMMVGAAAAGYVLGSRAGRRRYEQIKTQANRFWHEPKVRQAASQAMDLAQDVAIQAEKKLADAVDLAREKAPEIQQKVADAAKKDAR